MVKIELKYSDAKMEIMCFPIMNVMSVCLVSILYSAIDA